MSDSNLNDASFTPEINDSEESTNKQTYSATGSFRFWCQKVLPLVYDDSLSYYELLCKVVNYLNNVIQNVDNLNTSVDNTNTAFNNLQNYVNTTKDTLVEVYSKLEQYVNDYFNNLDVQEEINTKLDAMASNGSLSKLLAPFIPSLVSDWLSENITPTSPAIDASLSVSGAGADAKVTGDRLSELNERIDNNENVLSFLPLNILTLKSTFTPVTSGNFTVTHNKLTDEYVLNGTTPTGQFNFWNIIDTAIPDEFIKVGETYTFDFSSTNGNFWIQMFLMTGDTINTAYDITGRTSITIAPGTNKIIVRLKASNTGNTYNNATLKISMRNADTYNYIPVSSVAIPDGTDLNNVNKNGVFICNSTYNYTNSPLPTGYAGMLCCFTDGANLTAQLFFAYGATEHSYYRTRIINNWSVWTPIGFQARAHEQLPADANSMGTKQYDGYWIIPDSATISNIPASLPCFLFNYSPSDRQTLQMCINWDTNTLYMRRRHDATWSIWSQISGGSTNAFLAPSGDNTDRTADIVAMLQTYGVCRLGKGDYYVSNLQMPEATMIIGAGIATRIILSGTSDGFAIKMTSSCQLSHIALFGSLSNISLSATVGNRHGILWQGTYTQNQVAPTEATIDAVYIRNFSGGGITCYDTGYGTHNALIVTNVDIVLCGAGINVAYWSEFHKFTNIKTMSCYYGCINNGGNNIFVNCDFSSCSMGMLMDNSQNQSPNNSHGSAIGCVFNHSGNNSGIGIKVLNCDNGFIFDGCQIFFSKIDLEDCEGVVFSNCNFGYSNCDITVVNGGVILFANNIHQNTPTITITNNDNVHFVNCYNKTTGAVISN